MRITVLLFILKQWPHLTQLNVYNFLNYYIVVYILIIFHFPHITWITLQMVLFFCQLFILISHTFLSAYSNYESYSNILNGIFKVKFIFFVLKSQDYFLYYCVFGLEYRRVNPYQLYVFPHKLCSQTQPSFFCLYLIKHLPSIGDCGICVISSSEPKKHDSWCVSWIYSEGYRSYIQTTT